MKNIYSLLLGLLIIASAGAGTANATTYTVCGLGCNSTSISGLFSTISPIGDDVIEVRADTPGGSKTYYEVVHTSGGGSSGHPVIFRARSGDNITIDSQEAVSSGNTLYVNNDYYIVDGFHVQGAQGSQIYVGPVGSGTTRNTGITIQNCSTYSASANGSANHDGIVVNRANSVTLYKNTFTTTSNYQGGNDTDCFYAAFFNDLTIDGNNCTTSTGSGALQTAHNDGVQISGGNGTNIPLGSAVNLIVRNNTFLHNSNRTGFKQCVYVEYEVQGYVQIYNNVCKDTLDANTNIISVYNKGYGSEGTVSIYNNSIFINGPIASAILTDEYVPNPYIINNIALWYGTNDYQTGINALSSTYIPSRINNNICYKVGGTVLRNRAGSATTFYTWTAWQSAGFDVNGHNVDPLYTNTITPPYNLMPQVSSLAINNGANISSIFNVDILGASRPQSGAWNIGAYQGLYKVASPPTNLRFF